MNPVPEHPLVAAYLSDFDAAAQSVLNESRRLELREEIAGHLRELVPASSSNVDAAALIADFGSPAEILGQEPQHRDRSPEKPKLTRNWVLGTAVGAATVLVIVSLVWLSFPVGDSGGRPTNNDSLETETSVVNKTPTGPDRVQDGTAYFEYLAAI